MIKSTVEIAGEQEVWDIRINFFPDSEVPMVEIRAPLGPEESTPFHLLVEVDKRNIKRFLQLLSELLTEATGGQIVFNVRREEVEK